MNRLIFWSVFAIYVVVYFLTLRFVWNRWVPWNATTDLLALFVVVVIAIPLAAFSADKTIALLQKESGN